MNLLIVSIKVALIFGIALFTYYFVLELIKTIKIIKEKRKNKNE